jgi:hypothetical protein
MWFFPPPEVRFPRLTPRLAHGVLSTQQCEVDPIQALLVGLAIKGAKIMKNIRRTKQNICDNGDPVFTNSWNSDNPGGGADCYTAYVWNDKYAVDYEGLHGPYDSLDAALKEMDGLAMVTPSTESVDSSVLSSQEVAAKLWSESDEPLEFTINNEEWIFEKGTGFRRVYDGLTGRPL